MASSKLDFPRFLPAPSCRSKVVIRSASVFKGELRTLLLNSGDLPPCLAHFLNSDLQGSPKFTRAGASKRADFACAEDHAILYPGANCESGLGLAHRAPYAPDDVV